MSNENVDLIRTAFEAYAKGDATAVLELVDPDLEWTYLDPSYEDAEPQVCHGRHELAVALQRQTDRGLRSELEEVVGRGDRVMVVVRTPGVDEHRAHRADDRNFDVITVREGRIVGLHACRNREEALRIAGIS